MKILRYLTRDVLTHMVAVSFVLLVVIFSGRFVKYLAEAAIGDLAADILLPVMFYRLPGFLELIIPLGLFIGILMAYGRLYVESEMVVLSACGVSPARLAGYTMVSALLVALLVGLLSLVVTPLGAARSEALLQDPSSSQGLQSLAAGRFQTRRGSDIVSYAQAIDPDTGVMQSVFLSQGNDRDGDNSRMVVTVAQEGEVRMDPDTGARYLELRNGYRYEGMPGRLDYRVTRFSRFGELIPEPAGGIRTAAPVDGRPTRELLDSDSPEDIAALHWRLSLPVMVPIVALIALCMSRTDHRRGRYIKMAPAFALYLAYLLLLANARSAVEDGDVGVLGGFWGVHGMFLALGLLMLYGGNLAQRFNYWRRNRART
ncbi:LPS export ABC transporter permease LptF [Parahaliea mediterranea]|uniref:Lipopolysaccharide export system permease protein LptF n=1 Tax=Parahaliea mediterranea TaxID=651086 RepID=A0A939ILT9_9GAMM|nr:LPS export ABC transporter permease LptF [Parahaliea mediterranea]MBN7796307.1 LPS export ABC transporter permease LptF [Parahaliea mediterranea]